MGSRRVFVLGLVSAALCCVVATAAGNVARVIPFPGLEGIGLPEGFKIETWASDVPGARSLSLGSDGTVFVGTRERGVVYALRDDDGLPGADRTFVIASGLAMPNGVSFRDGSLYVAEISRVIRFDNIESRLANPPRPVVVSEAFPRSQVHGWKFIAFGPDGKLYVPVGSPCNVCIPEGIHGTITRMNPDGTDLEVYARGIRNSVGFDWDPATGDLWFTDNGRDWLGDDEPPDELNRAPTAGLDFGFPYFYGDNVPDPKYGEGHTPDGFVEPAMDLGPHVAALGMRFYTGTMFPEAYRGQIFIAEHGSWDRTTPIGYRVVLVKIEKGHAVSRDVFADGWLRDGAAFGRPVDVLVAPDGSLLVSDDRAGRIYRISYAP